MSEHENQPIIIKKIKKSHGHHGGAWKIAYADFVTAMMAFFLLLWLLSLLNKYQLEGIAKYFQKPIKQVFVGNQKVRPNGASPQNMGSAKDQNQGGIPPFEKGANKQELLKLKNQMEKDLANDPVLSQYKNALNFVITANGLKIELHDLDNKPMFSSGRTDFEYYAESILSWLTKEINKYPNRVVVIGHTDSVPYQNGSTEYTNWELSADRANATRRSLINHGMQDQRIIRVIGTADSVPLNRTNPEDPANRRIEIIVLTDEAAKNDLGLK